MLLYHGSTNKTFLRKIRRISELFDHGFEFTPNNKIYSESNRFFLDNGAFTKDFNPSKWRRTISKFREYNNAPDFVVLPDVFDDPEATWRRHLEYVDDVKDAGFEYYSVAQKPDEAETVIEKACSINAKGIFVGGSWDWKHEETPKIVDLAHSEDLKVHIGLPKDYLWAYNTGADSMDTTNFSRNKAFSRFEEVEQKILKTLQ